MSIRNKFFNLAVLSCAIALTGHSEIVGQKIQLAEEPMVDWSASASSDPVRQAKNKRYDRLPPGRITETPLHVEELPVNVHWWQGISGLPVEKSDAIVLGYVIDAKAFLSNNRSVVYSEFSVQTLQVLKNSTLKSLSDGSTIVADRFGGAVVFPSGKVQHYRISNQGLPRTNQEYILFLKLNGEDFDIITGYAINNGRVSPLDEGPGLPFAKYQGRAVDYFLTELREAMSTSSTKGPQSKWHTALTFPSR